ncbi:N-acyl amino acid synthase FeeM domain-containing protein [Leptolyngbya ohadii]|uniref:N-acyl amino acid synthase FeeM domain-containing protein n=1 Tax=Leptolyngbya ohadii TaxID=1962290 RepID=UPI00117AE30B|nr:GNAT family N-acyltransferase [Leptolyngbya ohadii]
MSTHKSLLGAQSKELAFHSKPLESDHEIRIAQRLVYRVFVNEMGWIPPADNPSGIQFVEDQAAPRFVDHFDQTALWFGTFYHQKLIACWRFCQPLDGKFELEHYQPLPNFLKASRSLEVTRLVIDPSHRKRSRGLLHLAQTTYRHLCDRFDYTFAAVEFPHPGDLYLKLGSKQADVKPFKYSPLDPNEVQLIVLDLKNRETLASGYRKYSQ